VAPDGGGDVAPQLQPVVQDAVGVVEELHLVHAHHRGARALLGHAHPGGLLGRHAVDAGLALGDEQVGDAVPVPGPAGDGGGAAVLEVVRMGDDRQGALPVLGERLQRGVSLGHWAPGGAER
jgi:hypothetical protein